MRVGAAFLRQEAEPDDVLRLEELGLLGVGLPFQVDEALRTVGEKRQEILRVEVERDRDPFGHFLGVADLLRVRIDGGRLLADRECSARAVVDRAAAGGNRDRLPVLARGERVQAARADTLEPRGADERGGEDEREDGDHEPDPAVDEPCGHRRRRSAST